MGGQVGGTGGGARHGHPAAPTDRGRSNTDTQNAGATPRGTRASTADKEEGHSKAGEATGTAGTGNQNGADGRACAWEAATIKGMAWPANPVATGCQGNPCATGIRVGGVSCSPDGLFAQQEREPIRGRPAVRGKSTYGGRPGQRVEEQGTWASQKHSEAGHGWPVDRGVWTAKTVKRPRQQPAHPQYANYWAPVTCKRHTMPHSAQAQHTNYWARERGNDTSKSTGRSGRQKAATRRNMRREEGVTVQGPVKEQQPDGMSHRGLAQGLGIWGVSGGGGGG